MIRDVNKTSKARFYHPQWSACAKSFFLFIFFAFCFHLLNKQTFWRMPMSTGYCENKIMVHYFILKLFKPVFAKLFWATVVFPNYLQIFFHGTHQLSTQPTRKDNTNSKINNTKSVRKINHYKQANHISEEANRDAR